MEAQFQTSFIPKKPLAEDRVVQTQPVSILTFVGTIIFIASLIGAGAVYFMKAGLERSVVSMKSQLEAASGAFEKDFITELQTTDQRINAARTVLGNHVVVSPVFQTLQQSTLKSVQFTKFSYTTSGTGTNAKVDVSMTGRAQSYTAIALQSDALTKNKYIKDPVFSDLTLDDQGSVLFSLSFSVDPRLVSFGDSLSRLPGSTDAVQSSASLPVVQAGTSDLTGNASVSTEMTGDGFVSPTGTQ